MDSPSLWDMVLGSVLLAVIVLQVLAGDLGAAYERLRGRPNRVDALERRLGPPSGVAAGAAQPAGREPAPERPPLPAPGQPIVLPSPEAAKAQRQEAEEAERRAEDERQRAEEERRRAEEEMRQHIAAATPRVQLSAGGSYRESVTINLKIEGQMPMNAQLAVLSRAWAYAPVRANFGQRRADGWFEEQWYKIRSNSARPLWGGFTDAAGRTFPTPDEPPADDTVWVALTYDRSVGGPASAWQRFRVSGAGPLWQLTGAVGEPLLIETSDAESAIGAVRRPEPDAAPDAA